MGQRGVEVALLDADEHQRRPGVGEVRLVLEHQRAAHALLEMQASAVEVADHDLEVGEVVERDRRPAHIGELLEDRDGALRLD